jgi:hypothetical protein
MQACYTQSGDIRSGQRVLRNVDARSIKDANRIIRSARASSVISAGLRERHLETLPPARAALLTEPIHSLLVDRSQTLQSRYASAGLPRGLLSPQARQIIYKKTCVRIDDRDLERVFARPFQPESTPSAAAAVKGTVYRASPLAADRIETKGDGQTNKILNALGELAKKVLTQLFLEIKQEVEDWWRLDHMHPFEILEPLVWCPKIKVPMYEELRERMIDYLLPQLKNIENNRVFFLKENRKFIEAFMLGMNHEMLREMVWREFPTDMHGTIFQYFWEPREDVPSQISTKNRVLVARLLRSRCGAEAEQLFKEAYPLPPDWVPLTVSLSADAATKSKLAELLSQIDYYATIKEVARQKVDDPSEVGSGWFKQPGGSGPWEPTSLGQNAPDWEGGADRLVVGIKGDLIRQLPHPLVFLAKKRPEETLDDVLDRLFRPDQIGIYQPEVQAVVGSDLLLLGFPVSADEVKREKENWVFTISEMPSLPRFGLDKPETLNSPSLPAVDLSNVQWAQVVADPASWWITRFKDFKVTTTGEAISWTSLNSSTIANLTLQQPSRLVFPFSRIMEA